MKTSLLSRTILVAAVALVPATAQAKAGGVTVTAKPKAPRASTLVTFKGRAGTKAGKRVMVQRRSGRKWTTLAKGRTAKRGAYALTWIAPSKKAKLKVRTTLGGKKSKLRSLTIRPRPKGAPKVRVSKKTRIIAPSAVSSIPAPGEPGKVTYAGGNDIAKGALVVVGKGPDTPEGFLGRVTDVDRAGGATVAQTVPATLIDAVPEGSTELHAEKVTTRTYTRAAKITCEGSAGFSITPDVTFTAGLDFAGAWGGVFEGPVSASVTASASFNASVEAAVAASGSCALAKRSLLSVKGPSVTGAVGPVPIVLTSNLTIYFDADAGVEGKIATSAGAGFDASAGIAWTKAGGFTSTQSFDPHFDFSPPELSASAHVGAHLTPTVDVLLYGIGGPRVALQTGIEFDASTTMDPWWELKVPVRLTGSLAIPVLDLESPQLDIYSRDFPIADAGGAFGAPTPPPPPPVHNEASPLTSLAVGFGQSCAVRGDKTVVCWGNDDYNALGNGGGNTASATPVPVTGITDATAVFAGSHHTCALRAEGSIKCWGDNSAGQLGDGTKTARTTPVDVKGITNAVGLSLGLEYSCALLNTGRVSCWGANYAHQLGDGTTTPSTFPIPVKDLRDVKSIAGGYRHSCAVLTSGAASCWGDNSNGQLGNGTKNAALQPVAVSGLTDATLVAAGLGHSCALRADETVSCWGTNGQSQIGPGAFTPESLTPRTVNGVNTVTAIGLGDTNSCAVGAGGGVTCWGSNDYGQIGNGMTGKTSTPAAVSGLGDAKGVDGGSGHFCALRANGAIACWGYGLEGQLGNGEKKSSSVPVAVSGFPAT